MSCTGPRIPLLGYRVLGYTSAPLDPNQRPGVSIHMFYSQENDEDVVEALLILERRESARSQDSLLLSLHYRIRMTEALSFSFKGRSTWTGAPKTITTTKTIRFIFK